MSRTSLDTFRTTSSIYTVKCQGPKFLNLGSSVERTKVLFWLVHSGVRRQSEFQTGAQLELGVWIPVAVAITDSTIFQLSFNEVS